MESRRGGDGVRDSRDGVRDGEDGGRRAPSPHHAPRPTRRQVWSRALPRASLAPPGVAAPSRAPPGSGLATLGLGRAPSLATLERRACCPPPVAARLLTDPSRPKLHCA